MFRDDHLDFLGRFYPFSSFMDGPLVGLTTFFCVRSRARWCRFSNWIDGQINPKFFCWWYTSTSFCVLWGVVPLQWLLGWLLLDIFFKFMYCRGNLEETKSLIFDVIQFSIFFMKKLVISRFLWKFEINAKKINNSNFLRFLVDVILWNCLGDF